MANSEHVKRLKQGVEEWNAWRRENPNVFHADLSNADLSGANLSGARLSTAELSGADLRGADLTGGANRPSKGASSQRRMTMRRFSTLCAAFASKLVNSIRV